MNADLDVVGYYVNHAATDRPPMPTGAARTISYNNLPFGSFHSTGANFAYADGSVHFVSDDIAMNVYLAFASRNGNETVFE